MNEQELQDAFAQLPPMKKIDGPWDRHRREIRRHVQKDAIEGFTSWSTIIATMYVGECHRLEDERRELTKYFADGFDRVVRPTRFEEVPSNVLNQLYHLYRWEAHSATRVNQLDTIVEFGGGYGAMCIVARRLGFTGEYHIYDLPELSLLQQYYLSNVDIPHMNGNYFHRVEDQRFSVPPDDVDLLIGCCSLSEVGMELREAFFGAIKSRHCLILYQSTLMEENLLEYFSHFIQKKDKYTWFQEDYPYMQTHHYLIGRKIDE